MKQRWFTDKAFTSRSKEKKKTPKHAGNEEKMVIAEVNEVKTKLQNRNFSKLRSSHPPQKKIL